MQPRRQKSRQHERETGYKPPSMGCRSQAKSYVQRTFLLHENYDGARLHLGRRFLHLKYENGGCVRNATAYLVPPSGKRNRETDLSFSELLHLLLVSLTKKSAREVDLLFTAARSEGTLQSVLKLHCSSRSRHKVPSGGKDSAAPARRPHCSPRCAKREKKDWGQVYAAVATRAASRARAGRFTFLQRSPLLTAAQRRRGNRSCVESERAV